MNPACKIDLAGRECQKWMTKVCAHCSSLLPDAEEAALWDRWWPNELPSPYKSLVNYMSAFDCHKLRREVARLVEESLSSTDESTESWTYSRIYGYIFVAILVGVVLILLMCVLWMLVVTLRHHPQKAPPSPLPKGKDKDVEAAKYKKSSSESATLRNPVKLAFAEESDSRTHHRLYRKRSSSELNSMYNQENNSSYPEPGTAQQGRREQHRFK
ncbi:uncharacterized protein DMAD_08555 [Drosophila madeirensis]|uniref:Uncharacterized protein n=1 Tax=Drosophila madeirensis TaxID=30013 RepID=A0AAU9F5D8_DROMD